MENILLVAVGGAIGASCRFGISVFATRYFPDSPILTGTILANATGCLLAGIFLGAAEANLVENALLLLFLSTGLLGAFTTFSTFSLELFHRLSGSWKVLLGYLLLQLVVAIGLLFLGYTCTYQMLTGGWFA